VPYRVLFAMFLPARMKAAQEGSSLVTASESICWLGLPQRWTSIFSTKCPSCLPRSGKSISLALMFVILGNLTAPSCEPLHRPREGRGQKVVTRLYIREFNFHRRGPDFPVRLFFESFPLRPAFGFGVNSNFSVSCGMTAHSESFPGDRTPDCRLIMKLLKGAVRRYAHL
jgi:hypothetical protein